METLESQKLKREALLKSIERAPKKKKGTVHAKRKKH